jgi:AbrB family looped-hinge helix DNA binding protein
MEGILPVHFSRVPSKKFAPMTTATVSQNGRVVIPAAIRRGLGIKAGTELDFEVEGATIRVSLRQPVPPANLVAGYGLLRAKSIGKPRSLVDFDAA